MNEEKRILPGGETNEAGARNSCGEEIPADAKTHRTNRHPHARHHRHFACSA